MAKPFTPKVVTANALLEGDVIYQTATGWTRKLEEAEVLTDVRLIDAIQQADLTVGAYLADVDTSTDTPKPSHFREAFRAKGPSNYTHGKQEVQ